jgi:hypothetical protein
MLQVSTSASAAPTTADGWTTLPSPAIRNGHRRTFTAAFLAQAFRHMLATDARLSARPRSRRASSRLIFRPAKQTRSVTWACRLTALQISAGFFFDIRSIAPHRLSAACRCPHAVVKEPKTHDGELPR